jgi:hypothetical protein
MLNQATREFIQAHRFDDVQKLALQSKFSFDSEIDWQEALTQLAGCQTIENKIPSWYAWDKIIYPVRLSLEQCSSEMTAQYKASLLSGNSLVDLTGGFGVDTAFLSVNFTQVDYVERDEKLSTIAGHNFGVLGLNHIRTHCADGITYLQQIQAVDCIYLDPARRSDSGKKLMLIEDCEPNLIEIQELLLDKANQVLIKLSPMLDINAALKVLKSLREIHVVSVENECKELLFLLEKENKKKPIITTINLKKNGNHQCLSFPISEEKEITINYTSQLQTYLYEPNTSLLKAGFFKGISQHYQINKIHSDSHLYTSSQLIADFPGRIFKIEAVYSMSKADLNLLSKELEKANIAVRNFPLSVAELRKKLKLKEGDENYLFATTLANEKHVLIQCKKEYLI